MTVIKNANLVSSAMGYWPSFHDAEIIDFETVGETVTVKIHVWEMTSEVDDAGFFGKRNHHMVTLIADGVTHVEGPEDATLFGTLFELSAELDGERVILELEGVCNEGTVVIYCTECRVATVDPYTDSQ